MGKPVVVNTIKGVPTEHVADPALGVKEYTDSGGNITLSLFIGDHRWVESEFSPEQCVQIIACILSKPSMTEAAKPLIEALKVM